MPEQIYVSWAEFQKLRQDDCRFKQEGNGRWKTEVDIVITDSLARSDLSVNTTVYAKMSSFREVEFDDVRIVYPYKNGICSCFAPKEMAITLYVEAGAKINGVAVSTAGIQTIVQLESDYQAEAGGGSVVNPGSGLLGRTHAGYGATGSAADPVGPA